MASDVTMMLFVVTLLLLNLIIIIIILINARKKPSILSIRISSECGVAAMEVTKVWRMFLISKLRCVYCLADVTFLEDVIDLLLT